MKVCYVADNRVRLNYGCRASSMALHDIIAQYHDIDSTIYGDMKSGYSVELYRGRVRVTRWARYLGKIKNILSRIFLNKPYIAKDEANFIAGDVTTSLRIFMKCYDKFQPLRELYDKINNADAVMVNGEGSFIFREGTRYDLNFILFILALAQLLGKKTYLLNSVFSDGTSSEKNVRDIEQTREICLKCNLVTARDKLSYKYYRDNVAENIVYVPDALFSWLKFSSYMPMALMFPYAGVVFPEMQIQWQPFDFSKPYVAVSSASREKYRDDKEYIDRYVVLVNALKAQYRVVIVQTCGGEDFLKHVAKLTNTKIIDVHTNILFGMSVLTNAQCYVSGRWHPSILASLGGTPCVMMSSNSHKSMAIYEELEYDDKVLFSNLPSDDEIAEILAKVDNSIKYVDRANIINKIMIKNEQLKMYEKLLQ